MALKERKLEVIDWKEKGKAVGGYLTRVELVRFKDGGKATTYLVQRVDDSIVFFRGATQLDMRLNVNDLGKYIEIEYLGEDASREMSEGRNRPKLFRVKVDDERKIAVGRVEGDPGIQDSDIPF